MCHFLRTCVTFDPPNCLQGEAISAHSSVQCEASGTQVWELMCLQWINKTSTHSRILCDCTVCAGLLYDYESTWRPNVPQGKPGTQHETEKQHEHMIISL